MREKLQKQIPLMAHILDHPQSQELEVISGIVDENPTIRDYILQDLNKGKSESQRAGAKGMSAEQVLRCTIVKFLFDFTYEDLAFHIVDSQSLRWFCRIGIAEEGFKKSALNRKDSGGSIVYASGKTSFKSLSVNLSSIPLIYGSIYKWYVVVYANGLEDSSEDRYFTYNFKGTPCLKIVEFAVKDIKTDTIIMPKSGEPAQVKFKVKNEGSGKSDNIVVNAGIYSIDLPNDECDFDQLSNNEVIIQTQVKNIEIESLAPGGTSTEKTLDAVFIRECFTNELRLVLSFDKPLCEENIFIMEKISPFYLYPNEDAYWNCFGELTAVATAVILGNSPFADLIPMLNTDTEIGILMGKFLKAAKEGDSKTAGEVMFNYSVLLMKFIYEDLTNKTIINKFHTIMTVISNEVNNKACSEALPRMTHLWVEFFNGIAKGIADYGIKVWTFTVGSPADIEVVDANGNVVYVNKEGSIQDSIPDSLEFIINNGTDNPIKCINIFGEGPYMVHLIGTSEGMGSLHITQTKNDGTLVSINYEDIPLSSQMTANLSISGEDSEYPLDIDQDGDGSIDQTMIPNSAAVLVTHSAPDPACVSKKLRTTSTLCTVLMNCWIKQIKDTKNQYDVTHYTDLSIQGFGTSWSKAQALADKKGLNCDVGSEEEIGGMINDAIESIYNQIYSNTDQTNKNSISLGSALLNATKIRCSSLLNAQRAYIKDKSAQKDAKLSTAIANANRAFSKSFSKAKAKAINKWLSCDDSMKSYLEGAIDNLESNILSGMGL